MKSLGAWLHTMRVPDRRWHPTRVFCDNVIRSRFGTRPFRWLEVGCLGMVDYERLRPRLRFSFVGADRSPVVVNDGRRFLKSGDTLRVWDMTTPPPHDLGTFDLVTCRSVLNHVDSYDAPLANLAACVTPGGLLLLTLHLHFVEGDDHRLPPEDSPFGVHYGNFWSRERFFLVAGEVLSVDRWVRIGQGSRKTWEVLLCSVPAKPGIPPMETWRATLPTRLHLAIRRRLRT